MGEELERLDKIKKGELDAQELGRSTRPLAVDSKYLSIGAGLESAPQDNYGR
jgi:hypothetical protein